MDKSGPGSGRFADQDRQLWKLILFSLLTFGIYGIVFYVSMIRDLNLVCGHVEKNDQKKSPGFLLLILLSVVTLSIYYYVWLNQQGERIRICGQEYGLKIDDKGSHYVLWSIFGVFLLGLGPLISMYILISNMNKLAAAYNYRIMHPQLTEGAEEASSLGFGGPTIGGTEDKRGTGGTSDQEMLSLTGSQSVKPHIIEDFDEVYDEPTSDVAYGTLECISGGFKGAVLHILPGREVTIGRNPQVCQVILQDRDISRVHCRVAFDNSVFFVTDLSTYNKTFLNDNIRLKGKERTQCPLGSKLTLGNGNNEFILR